MDKKRVGILRGGPEDYYDTSLEKGGSIMAHILENLNNQYNVIDILIDKENIWHIGGIPIEPANLFYHADVVWNTSHPSFSNILDSLSISNVSAGFFASALANNRGILKEHVKNIGLDMPRHIISPKNAQEVFEKFSGPWVVKSFTKDSNMGIHLVKTFPELINAIEDGVKREKTILVEEFIAGKVASVHSVSKFRQQDVYTFPLGNTFGNFSLKEKEKLANLTKILHKHIDAKNYLKSDFVLTPRGKVYLLSIELMPDLKSGSHFFQVCESVGAKTHQVIEHILEKTRRGVVHR